MTNDVESDCVESSEYDSRVATLDGRMGLAAARLAQKVTRLIDLAKRSSGMSNKDVAEQMGVSDGRISQLLNGDGNIRVATLARVLEAFECTDLEFSMKDSSGRPISTAMRSRAKNLKRSETGQRNKTWDHAFTITFGDADGVHDQTAIVKSRRAEIPVPLEIQPVGGGIIAHRHIAFDPERNIDSWIQRTDTAVAHEGSYSVLQDIT